MHQQEGALTMEAEVGGCGATGHGTLAAPRNWRRQGNDFPIQLSPGMQACQPILDF